MILEQRRSLRPLQCQTVRCTKWVGVEVGSIIRTVDASLRSPVALLGLILGLSLSVASSLAQDVRPERASASASWLVLDDAAPALREPREGARRRGTVRVNTRLPNLGLVRGSGCPGESWARVGPQLYICAEHVRASRLPPAGESIPRVAEGEILPRRYAFVRYDGTRAYRHPNDAFVDRFEETYGEGFGLVVTERRDVRDVSFLKTRRGLWVEADSLGFARGSTFAGREIAEGEAGDLGWVLPRHANVHARAGGRVTGYLGRREVVHIASTRRGWVELARGGFMRERDVAHMTEAPRPSELGDDERWIDVDVDEQVLTVYEGARPVFATLVSTGRADRAHATPLGEFHIWAKLAFSDMTNLARAHVRRNYAIEAVPWVQYFERANGLHAAFWHDDFGHRHSHGCVNLSPRDARRLFDLTSPALPVGWKAILPETADHPTLVRVR